MLVLAFCGYFQRSCGHCAKVPHTPISSGLTSHINLESGNYLYILLPAAGVVLTALYVRLRGARQYQSRCDARALRHIAEKEPLEAP